MKIKLPSPPKKQEHPAIRKAPNLFLPPQLNALLLVSAHHFGPFLFFLMSLWREKGDSRRHSTLQNN